MKPPTSLGESEGRGSFSKGICFQGYALLQRIGNPYFFGEAVMLKPLMFKVTMSFAPLLLVAGTAAAQNHTAAPAAATDVQPAPASAEDISEKPAIDVAAPSAEPQKAETSAAIPSTPAPAAKPTAKRAAARQHSTATRERPWVAYPSYASPL